MKVSVYYLPILIFILSAISCSQRLHSWKAASYPTRHFQKVLVLGFLREEDNSMRENIENQVADELNKKNINTVTSLQLLGTKVFARMDEDDALYQLNNQCVDAVLTVTVLNRSREKKYTAGVIHYTPYGYSYDRFWRYKTAIKYRISSEDYYASGEDYFLECNLYDMTTQQLVYSVQSRHALIEEFEKEGNKFIQKIVRAIVKKGVLENPKSR